MFTTVNAQNRLILGEAVSKTETSFKKGKWEGGQCRKYHTQRGNSAV